MTRFAFCNHWYPEAWNAWQRQGGPPLHGTADFWDVALQSAGHESQTFVLNAYSSVGAMMAEVHAYNPAVLCTMEVGRFPAHLLRSACPDATLVAFCSHRAEDDALRGFGVVFSSFKWMPEYCQSIGIRCEYLPLAFGKPVLERVQYDGPRDIDVAFIGGLGTRTWKAGTETMAAIAEAVPAFEWHGYFQGSLSDFPAALQKAYRGEAWGADAYRLLMRTKVLVNRHGEIARGFANNCRAYEGPGCGCFILSDFEGEMAAVIYSSPADASYCVRESLNNSDIRETAELSQRIVIADHTFESRVPRFLEVVNSL